MISDELEKTAWSANKLLCGIDESGLGSGAGSLWVAAVIFPREYDFSALAGLNDSKRLTEKKRFDLEGKIKQDALFWFCDKIEAADIDQETAYHARFRLAKQYLFEISQQNDSFVIIMDGNVAIPFPQHPKIDNKCLIKGDAKCFSVAAASILAKTAKDKEMICLHEQYPVYDWCSNKGYLTAKHREVIKKHGLTEYHRRSFCKNIEVLNAA